MCFQKKKKKRNHQKEIIIMDSLTSCPDRTNDTNPMILQPEMGASLVSPV